MSKALVTGATGFIGPHLVEALARRGHEVACLVRATSRTERLEPFGPRLLQGDVTDAASLRAAVEHVDAVYHLAGVTKTLRSEEMTRVNEQGVRNVAEACAARTSPPVLIVVSSLAAAGPSPDNRLRIESDPPRPVSHYGRSKRAGELAAESLADKLPISIVRPPIVFGEGDTDMLQMIRPIARFGLHLVPGLGRQRVSLIHAADLAEALIAATERGTRLPPASDGPRAPGRGYYFVAFDDHPTYRQLGRKIADAVGRRMMLVIPAPGVMTWIVAGASELLARLRRRPNIFNLDKAREATAGSWACSAEVASRELDFRPAAALDERLRQTVDWYRAHGWL